MKTNSWMKGVVWAVLWIFGGAGFGESANVIRWRESSGYIPENWQVFETVLEREGDLRSELVVTIETRNGNATGGVDFVLRNQKVTFLAGEAATTVNVSILNDGLHEANERFQLVIASVPNAWVVQGRSLLAVTIEDNDPGFAFGLGGETATYEKLVTEAEGVVRIPVQRGADSSEEVWIDYEILPGTAVAGEDYLGSQGRLLFAAHDSMQWIQIPIVSDTVTESAQEVFTVRITQSSPGTSMGNVRLARITVLDDDLGPSLELVGSLGGVLESSDGFHIRIYRGQLPAVGRVEVGYRTVLGSALPGQDYIPIEGVLSFEPGELVKTLVIPVIPDALREGDEDLSFELFSIPGSPAPSIQNVLHLVIEDDDLGFRIDPSSVNYSVREEGEPVVVRVLRADDRPQPMSVGFRTVAGSATAGEDFVPLQGRLNFGPTERSLEVVIPLIDDPLREPQEIFTLELFEPEGGALAEFPNVTILISASDESPNYYVAPKATESEGMGRVYISLFEPADHAVQYRVTVDSFGGPGGAIPGSDLRTSDFEPIEQMVTIPAGERSTVVLFPVSTQHRNRSSEERKLIVRVKPVDASEASTESNQEFSIEDDPQDFELVRPFNLPWSSAIPEAAGTVDYRLRRRGDLSSPAVVSYEVRGFDRPDAARPGVDFVPGQGTLRFERGEIEKVIPLTVIDGRDSNPANQVSFELALNLIEGEGSLGSMAPPDHPRRASVGLMILDNEPPSQPPASPSFALESSFGSQLVEMEGQTEVILRRLSGVEFPVMCRVEVREVDPMTALIYDPEIRYATPNVDFDVASTSLDYASGQSAASFKVGLHADSEVEGTEAIQFTFTWVEPSGASNRVSWLIDLLDSTPLPLRLHPLTRDELKTLDLAKNERVFADGSWLLAETISDSGKGTSVLRVDRSGVARSNFVSPLPRRGIGLPSGNAPYNDVTLAAQGDRFWMMYPPLPIVPTLRLQRFLSTGQPDSEVAPMELRTLATFAYSQVWKTELWYPLRLIPEDGRSIVLVGPTRWVNGRLTPYGVRIIPTPQELDIAMLSATVSESDGARPLMIRRFGDIRQAASYRWTFVDGTATAGRDYVPGSGVLEFASGQSVSRIPLTVLDNDVAELDRALVLRFERVDSGRVAAEIDVVVANDDPGVLEILPVSGDPSRLRLIVTGPLTKQSSIRDVNLLISRDLLHWTPVVADTSLPLGFYPDDPGQRVLIEHHQQYFRVESVRR